jgi:hypothetical protein
MADTVRVRTGVDTYADQERPNGNFGQAANIILNGNSGANKVKQGFIYFRRPFDLGVTVSSAILRMRTRGTTWTGTNVLTPRRITQNWKEGTLTWNNRPSVAGAESGTTTVTDAGAGEQVDIDVTAIMQAAAAGQPFFGIRLTKDTNGDDKLHSYESDNNDYRPVLIVTYSIKPEQPSNLVPDGEKATSLAQPTLQWAFRTALGVALQAEFQVQIHTTDDFTTPAHDSGFVASTAEMYDLSTTSFSLTDNTQYFWRVRVKDDDGNTSDWSDTATFYRRTHGSLTIDSPPDSSTTSDNTPPITHTFSGRTQQFTEYVLFERDPVAAEFVELVREAKKATSAVSFTFPEKKNAKSRPYIRKLGTDYKVRLRVWDTFDREPLPGDPGYVEDTTTFQYAPDDGIAAVTNLTLSDVSNAPAVQLDWSRGSAPDGFAIIANGDVVDRVDESDVALGGGNYRFLYWGAVPGEETAYRVAPIVNGDLGNRGATVNHTARNIGVWVARPATEEAVLIVQRGGRTDRSFEIGETSATYSIVGRRDPVTIIDTIRGYEGRVGGLLADIFPNGPTAEDYRDQLLDFKGEGGSRPLRLIMSGLNIPIQLGKVEVTPSPDANTYVVSLEFFQVGEFTFRVITKR